MEEQTTERRCEVVIELPQDVVISMFDGPEAAARAVFERIKASMQGQGELHTMSLVEGELDHVEMRTFPDEMSGEGGDELIARLSLFLD